MISNPTAVVAGLIGTYAFLWALLHFTQDAREPPSVQDAVPFLGPIFSMGRAGSSFHSRLRDKLKLPIYTLRLPGTRLYVINDTDLVPVFQRQHRTLALSPVLVRFFSHFMGISGKSLEIMGRDSLEDHGFVHQITVDTRKILAPGLNLDDLNEKAVQILNDSLGALCVKKASTTVDLFAWASQEIMMATTNGIYGSKNPFKNPTVRDAFYKYEAGLVTLIIGFLSSVLGRQSLQARDILTDAFMKYYTEGGLDEDSSSVYARSRYEFPSKLGIPMRDIAKMEAGGSIGLVSNTMPATFWMLYHLLSDPIALRECRQEVSKAVTEMDGEVYLDLAYIKSSCPILASTMQEAFRFHSIGIIPRTVVEDHVLGGKYLLKKGSTVLVPNTVQHSSSPAWGDDVDKFYYKRFVKPRKHNPVAFRAFGGGVTLCPGRHFASTEMLAFASVILLRFDIKPVGRNGWETAGYRETNASFRLPKEDVKVELIPRDSKKWNVVFSEPGKAMEISSEDIMEAVGQSQVAH